MAAYHLGIAARHWLFCIQLFIGMVLDCIYRTRTAAWWLRSLAVCLTVALAAPPVRAQNDAADVAEAAATASASDQAVPAPVSPLFEELKGKIERVGPDTFILLNEQGEPQPVLNMSIEQFIDAWKQQQAIRAAGEEAADDHTLDECRLIGSLEGNHVALSASFTVTLHTSGTVQVPLGMGGTLLRKLPTPSADRNGGRYLRYDPSSGGFLATLSGEPGKRVQVDLELLAPVRRDGTRATMELLAPRATKGSLVLVSKSAMQSVVASEGVVLSANPLVAGGMRVEAEGVAGEFSLSWMDRPATEPTESVLSASSQLLLSIDGRDIRSSARITVDAFGQSFREFVVRLPPGARHVPTGYTAPFEEVALISASASAGEEAGANPARGSELRVTLSADQSDPVTIQLQTIEPLHGTGDGIEFTLTGFEVVDAVPQEGEVSIQVDDGWQLRWEPNDSVRLVHPSEVDLSWMSPEVTANSLTAALRFVRQPWSLPVRLVPREQRVVATPSYALTINADEAVLRMDVEYRIEGARTLPTLFNPRFALAGWDHQQTTTRNVEDAIEVEQLDDTFAIETASATSRRPMVTLEFRRSLDESDDGTFVLPLPEPQGDGLVLNSSDVTITADTSLKLTPDATATLGLVAVPVDGATDAAAGQPPGQQFRYRGVYPPLVFAARKEPRQQRLLVSSDSRVNMGSDQVTVEQDIDFDVRHQPLSALLLSAPSMLTNLQLELLPARSSAEGDEGTPLEIPGVLADAASEGPTLPEWSIPLPHPRLGKFRVRARYMLETLSGTGNTVVLPFLTVPGAEFREHRLRLEPPAGKTLLPVTGSRWRLAESDDDETVRTATTLTTDRQTSYLTLSAAGRSPTTHNLEIEKIWVQTWITPRTTQSRTAFRFRGGTGRVRIELPTDAPIGEQFEVVVDSLPSTSWLRREGALLVDLPADAAGDERTLELRYRMPASPNWTVLVAPGRPQLVGDESGANLFWQVVAPVEYQHVSSSNSLVSASRTAWTDGDWRSSGEMSTAEIEQWVGASTDSVRPTRGEHTFLYRGSPSATLEDRLVRRELLVMAASGVVLAACFAFAYLSWLRQVPVLLVCLAAVVTMGLAAPQFMATVAPLGLYGLVCGLMLWVLRVMRGPMQPSTSSTHGSVLGRSETSGTHRGSTVVPLGAGHASSNAPTVSVELTDSNV